MEMIVSLFDRALGLAKRLDWFALLVVRLTVGIEFVSTGWGKVHNLAKVTAYFGELGIPAPGLNATVASFTELLGGTLLVLGLGSRLAACPLVITMVVAIVTAKRDELHGITDLVGFIEWTYLVLLGVVVVMGPGPISLDTLVRRKFPAPAATASVSKL